MNASTQTAASRNRVLIVKDRGGNTECTGAVTALAGLPLEILMRLIRLRREEALEYALKNHMVIHRGTPDRFDVKPAGMQPPVTQPAVTQPSSVQPSVTQPPIIQPEVMQPPVTQPPMTQPSVMQPAVNQPLMTQPPMTQPAVTQPPMMQPADIQPPVTQPAAQVNFDFDMSQLISAAATASDILHEEPYEPCVRKPTHPSKLPTGLSRGIDFLQPCAPEVRAAAMRKPLKKKAAPRKKASTPTSMPTMDELLDCSSDDSPPPPKKQAFRCKYWQLGCTKYLPIKGNMKQHIRSCAYKPSE